MSNRSKEQYMASLPETPVGTVSPSQSPPTAPLSRGLGVGSIVFMVVAAAAPMTAVAGGTPIVISSSGGVAAPLLYLVCGALLVCFAVGFMSMSRYVHNAGAFYTYIQTGLGRIVGAGAATLALWSYLLILVATVIYTGVLLSDLSTRFGGPAIPWWAAGLVVLAFNAILGYRDIELSAKVLGFFLVAETVVILVMDISIMARGGADGLNATPLLPSSFTQGSPSLGLMFAYLGFIGFEATAVFRNEARDPDRTIPRATYIAVISIGLFYGFSAWAVLMGMGVENAVQMSTDDPAGVVISLGVKYLSPILGDIMQVLFFTSFLACSLSFHNVMTRYQFTLANVGLLPRRLGAVNARHRAPSFASMVLSVLTTLAVVICAFTSLEPITLYTWMSGAAVLGLVALMALASVAVIVFFRRHKTGQPLWQTLVAPVIATLGLGAILVMVVVNFGLLVGGDTVSVVMEVIMAAGFIVGLVVALVMRSRRPEAYLELIKDA